MWEIGINILNQKIFLKILEWALLVIKNLKVQRYSSALAESPEAGRINLVASYWALKLLRYRDLNPKVDSNIFNFFTPPGHQALHKKKFFFNVNLT